MIEPCSLTFFPGQVYYNSTRKLVLRGVDGIVFVADSQRSRQAENLESLQNLRQNLQDYGMNLDDIPFVLQYNKRDMENVFTLDEMNEMLNPEKKLQFFPATAHNGKGVVTTLKTIAMLVIEKFNVKQGFLRKAAVNAGAAAPASDAPAENADAKPQAASAAPQQPTSPFRMPSFAAKPQANMANSGGAGSGLFQKGAMSSPFARPRVSTAVPRMPTFGRSVDKPAQTDDDEIVLRPYKPKDK